MNSGIVCIANIEKNLGKIAVIFDSVEMKDERQQCDDARG